MEQADHSSLQPLALGVEVYYPVVLLVLPQEKACFLREVPAAAEAVVLAGPALGLVVVLQPLLGLEAQVQGQALDGAALQRPEPQEHVVAPKNQMQRPLQQSGWESLAACLL